MAGWRVDRSELIGGPLEQRDLPRVRGCDRRDDVDDYRAVFGAEAVARRRFYNVGAGKFSHPVWTNVDFSHPAYDKLARRSAFIDHDLSSGAPLPIDDGVACLVYTSHTIEHLRDHAVQRLFEECHRVLRSGGVLRVVCPDIDLAHRAYRTGDWRYFRTFNQARLKNGVLQIPGEVRRPRVSLEVGFLAQFARQASHLDAIDGEPIERVVERVFADNDLADACDYFTGLCDDEVHRRSPGDHINWFNADKVVDMLTSAGFTRTWRSGYGQSACAVLRNRRYFDRTRPCFSLYVEAQR